MKKIALSILALAAVSTAALAERNYDLRDVKPFKGMETATVIETAPLSVAGADGMMQSAYEKMQMRAEDREEGGR